jgi:tetratricopeptide (TPR) repeat protein
VPRNSCTALFGYVSSGKRSATVCARSAKINASNGSLAITANEAAATYQRVVDYGEKVNDAEWIAKGSYGRANAELDQGNLSEASALFVKALAILRETGPATDRMCTEWGLARVVLHAGKVSEATRQLRDVIAAFETVGWVTNAALAGIDLSEALLVLERWEEIVKVAAHAYRVLKKAGNVTGALTALAYLKEAAAKRQLTPESFKVVREYLRRVEREPDLLFVPPPMIAR